MSNQRVRGLLAKARAEQREHEWSEVARIAKETGASREDIADDVQDIWGADGREDFERWVWEKLPIAARVEANRKAIRWEIEHPLDLRNPAPPKISKVNVAAARMQIQILERAGWPVSAKARRIANYKGPFRAEG